MKILYIYRHPDLGYSIGKVFRPIECEMRKYAEVSSLYLPIPNYSLNGLLTNIKEVRNAVKNSNYDIIHITGTEHYLIPFLRGFKIIVTIHDLGHYLSMKRFQSFPFYFTQILPLKYADKISCISKSAYKELQQSLHIKENIVSIIPDEVGEEFQKVEKEINLENPIILHIGTRPHKNLIRTIEAICGLSCRLRIIGKISEIEKQLLIEKKIDYSNVCDLSDKELLEEYKNADIINFPSCHEGFGMPIIEGQAIGRLVVTSNIEPMSSVAGGGAILCNPYEVSSIRNAYMEALSEKEKVYKIINKGYENVKKYRLATITKQYFALYKDTNAI